MIGPPGYTTIDELQALQYSDADIVSILGAGDPGSMNTGSGSTASTAGSLLASLMSGLQKAGVFGQQSQTLAYGVPPPGYVAVPGRGYVPATSAVSLSNPLILIGLLAIGVALVVHYA